MEKCIICWIYSYSYFLYHYMHLKEKKGYHQNHFKNHNNFYFMGIAIFTKIIISLQPDMTKQLQYNSLTDWYLHTQRELSRIQKIDSETDISSDSDYDKFGNKIIFVGDILQLFPFEPLFTAAEIQNNKDVAGTNA